MSKTLATLCFLAVATACANAKQDADMVIPPELEELRNNALACSRDVAWTHAERSEHCVLVAENIFAAGDDECWESLTSECLNWRLVHSDITLIYQGATAESLFDHGKSDEIVELAKGEFWREVYLNGRTMRELFNRCIIDENGELEKSGLTKVHSLALRPLSENQRCFRHGYPDFEKNQAKIS